MRIWKNLALTAVAIALTATLSIAGESHKCESSTQECLDYMAQKMKDSGWVGIELDYADDGAHMQITKVVPDSPAEGAGMQPGDILFAMYGIELNGENSEKLEQARSEWKPGQQVTYTVQRAGQNHDIDLTLAAMPASVLANWIGRHLMEYHANNESDSASADTDGGS